MEKLNKSQRKKVINEALKDFYKKEKMSKYDIWDNGYSLRKDINGEDIYMGLLSFITSFQEISYGDWIHLKKVEDIITSIKSPDYDWAEHDKRGNLLATIRLSYLNGDSTLGKLYRSGLDWTTEDCLQFSKNIIEYFEDKVAPHFDYYTYLPNILIEMDKLESEGLNWNNMGKGILVGALDAYFRGLIISKLCNDPQFRHKIEIMDIKFAQKGYEAWVPHYEKLKLYLETLEPIYNI